MTGCKIVCRTFSPLHIGTGKTYGSAEILHQPPGFVRLRGDAVFDFIRRQKREDEFLRDMARGGEIRMGDYISKGYHEGLKRYSLQSHDPGNRFPLKDIRECVKTMDVPYIPGSSLKGAIRTAIIWKAVRDEPRFSDDLERSHKQPRAPSRKFVGNDYFSRLMSLGKQTKSDAKFDLLKFVEVSDMMPVSDPEGMLSLAGIVTYSLGSERLQPKPYQIFAECVPAEKEFSGSVHISPQLAAALKDKRSYPLLEEKLSMIGLDTDPEDVNALVSYLKRVCSEFSLVALEHELSLCYNNSELCECPNVCREALANRKNNLIRLGFAVGTGYQTVIHELIDQDVDLAADWITSMKLGKYPRKSTSDGLHLPYPKSIEFTTMRSSLGWIEW